MLELLINYYFLKVAILPLEAFRFLGLFCLQVTVATLSHDIHMWYCSCFKNMFLFTLLVC